MKAKITRYLIPLLILPIIITFCSFSCSIPGPGDQTIEETAQETTEEITVEEPEEEPVEEVAAGESGVEEVTDEPEEKIIEVSLKIIIWNETEENEPNLEVWIKGTGSWYPDKESMGFGGDFFIPVEPFSSEKVNEIYIYPDGRTGNEIMVEIIVTDEMISESDRDTIHIEIYDETVKVWGTSIEGITKEFNR